MFFLPTKSLFLPSPRLSLLLYILFLNLALPLAKQYRYRHSTSIDIHYSHCWSCYMQSHIIRPLCLQLCTPSHDIGCIAFVSMCLYLYTNQYQMDVLYKFPQFENKSSRLLVKTKNGDLPYVRCPVPKWIRSLQ